MSSPKVVSLATWRASPILATAVVPWTEKYEFDEAAFSHEVHALAATLTPHIYTFGTAGEGYAMSDAQFDRITTAFWKAAAAAKAIPMVGVVSLSLSTMIERIEKCHAKGFREFQISLPSWGALNDRELDAFFAAVCGRFPDCYFLNYKIARTKRVLGVAEFRRLSAAHPNLVAVKMGAPAMPQLQEMLTTLPGLKFYFTEAGYAEGRKVGDCGLLISLATVHHARAHEFVKGSHELRAEYGADLKIMLNKLIDLSKDKFHMDGAFDKMLARVNSPAFPLRLLPPYESASVADFEQFMAILPARWKPGAK